MPYVSTHPQVRLTIEPFWTVLRLKDGLAKLYAKFPFLLSGELSDPCYLGQAVCDEKDERVQVLLTIKILFYYTRYSTPGIIPR